MLGAIIGDIAGSRFEFHNLKSKQFDFFGPGCKYTDDSVMTLAVAKAITECRSAGSYDAMAKTCRSKMVELGNQYPRAGYGKMFRKWLKQSDQKPYNSFGNGSAMRVSACGFAATSLEEAARLAAASASVSHDHPEGIKGAVATAECIFLARKKAGKEEIRKHVEDKFYKLDFTIDGIRPTYQYEVSCQETVPQSIVAFLEATSYEDAIRNGISIGGDSDTIGAIVGGIAQAFFGIPDEIRTRGRRYLDARLNGILDTFFMLFPDARK